MEMSFRVFRTSQLTSSSSGTILLNSSLPNLPRCLPNPNREPPSAFLRSPFSKPNSSKPLPSSGGVFPYRFGFIFRRSNSSSSGRDGGVVAMAASTPVQKSDDEWRAILSPEQFRILRQKGTEYPGTGEYDKFFDEGVYTCAGCNTPLYKSTTKFNSGCGWPAFFEGLPGAINRIPDPDGRRIEITCSACGGHLGHVFKGEGFPTPTDERHCVNSVSLKFTPGKPE
ncbi:hypothetical protein V2J09_003309 [Rumex salicifolius]